VTAATIDARMVDHQPSVLRVSWTLARRSLTSILRIPAAFVPMLAMPIFFVVAFSGSFSSFTRFRAFPTDNVLDWFVPFAILQGSAFSGMATGFGTVRDLETRFYDRLLLAPGSRWPLLLGNVIAGVVRTTITVTVVLLFGLALGADVPGGALGLAMLWLASTGVSIVSTGWALGVVFRVQSSAAGPLLQIGIFMSMFLTIGQVPLEAQTGWVKHIAQVSPITNVLRMARQGFLGDVTWSLTWPGLVGLAAMITVLWVFAATGVRKLTP
jgi:ABC-2 type transport system permease protein